MGTKRARQLAGLLNLPVLSKSGPLLGASVTGPLDGYPIAVAWNQRQRQSTVTFLVRFKKGSLKVPPAELRERILSSPEILRAMDRTSISGSEKKALTVASDGILVYWDYAFRAPAPEAAASVLRILVTLIKDAATPVGSDCEVCGSAGAGELGMVGRALTSICAGCRERMGEEDRRRVEEYEARTANPLLGTLAGLGAAVGGAVLWGGVAYLLERIFLYGGILIGVGIAFAVNRGMGKINLYGRTLTVLLTLASVMMGDFVFMLLVAARQLGVPPSLDLTARIAPHFAEIEFANSSGYLSALFALLGAVYILFVNRGSALKRAFVPVTQGR